MEKHTLRRPSSHDGLLRTFTNDRTLLLVETKDKPRIHLTLRFSHSAHCLVEKQQRLFLKRSTRSYRLLTSRYRWSRPSRRQRVSFDELDWEIDHVTSYASYHATLNCNDGHVTENAFFFLNLARIRSFCFAIFV